MTRTERQNALLPAVTQADDAARLCGLALASLDTGTAALVARTVGTAEPLDAAAVLLKEAKAKIYAADRLMRQVANGE
jgi:hypothetical protein